MDKIYIGILGFGTVASGLYNAILLNNQNIKNLHGFEVVIKKIYVRDIKKVESKDFNFKIDYSLFTENAEDVLNDPEIDIIAELMGGNDFAFSCIKSAFENKKSVVSANKELISYEGVAIEKMATENGVFFRYEAAVGGGIPILQAINSSLEFENITSIKGILNGTTNYILTQMQDNNLGYNEALERAQESGFAEADPSSDVEGIDTARKLAILIRLCFSYNIRPDDFYTEGITKLTKNDVSLSDEFGLELKLLALAKINEKNELMAYVYPAFISKKDPHSCVKNEYNAVTLESNLLGKSMYAGSGAGALPNASAVLSDVCHIADYTLKKEELKSKFGASEKIFGREKNRASANLNLLPISERTGSYLIRLEGETIENAKIEIHSLLDNLEIKPVIIRDRQLSDGMDLVVMTSSCSEKQIDEFKNEIEKNSNYSLISIIRVEI